MFAVLHSDINSLKSGLLHLTSQPYCKKSRSAQVKDGIINLILRYYLIDRYNNVEKVIRNFGTDDKYLGYKHKMFMKFTTGWNSPAKLLSLLPAGR
jgi:hypothetical protein